MADYNTPNDEGVASSSNGLPQSNPQNAEVTDGPAQVRGRGKKRWTPVDIFQVAYAPQSVQGRLPDRPQASMNASRPAGNRRGLGYQPRNAESTGAAFTPQRPQATGNSSRPFGNRQGYQQQSTATNGATSSNGQHQTPRTPVGGPRNIPGAELAVSTSFLPHQVSASSSTPVAQQNNAAQRTPPHKKNRRQRGRGKNQASVPGSSAAGLTVRPIKGTVTFLTLPFELRERIIMEAYRMTLAELPDSHPKIHNRPQDMSPNAVRIRRQRPAAVTALRNQTPPIGLSNKQRKSWLWKNPGHWGPVFETMYTCKHMYDEARAIRYRHICVDAWGPDYGGVRNFNNNQILVNRLAYQPIQESTKEVVVIMHYRQPSITIKNLVEALGKLKSLTHVCVLIKGDNEWITRCRPGTDADLLLFFALDIETLTISWDWANNNPNDVDHDVVYGPNGESWVESPAERRLEEARKIWIEITYNPSKWYKAPEAWIANRIELIKPNFLDLINPNLLENTDKVAPGQVMKHVEMAQENRFYFAPTEDRNLTACPEWGRPWAIERKNPHNHPDQKR